VGVFVVTDLHIYIYKNIYTRRENYRRQLGAAQTIKLPSWEIEK